MFRRKLQEEILKSEGLDAQKRDGPPEAHPMSLTTILIDPENSKRQQPVVHAPAPYNRLDEAHRVRNLGVQRLAIGFLSLNSFIGAQKEVPYTASMSTFECVKYWMVCVNLVSINRFWARANSSGPPVGNPRTPFAWNAALLTNMARANLGGVVGVGGYFYAYELLCTYGLPPFRVVQPTPNAPKSAGDGGQGTYLARAAASLFPAVGYAISEGRLKGCMFWLCLSIAFSLQYEYARQYILPGMWLLYNVGASRELQRQADRDSPAPVLEHPVAPGANRNAGAAARRYLCAAAGPLQDTIWANATHGNLPFHRCGMKL